MKVQGMEITQAQIDACLTRMRQGQFRAYHITEAAEKAGVPRHWGADRLADRLIQRERKAGRILPVNRSGLWQPASSSPNGGSDRAG